MNDIFFTCNYICPKFFLKNTKNAFESSRQQYSNNDDGDDDDCPQRYTSCLVSAPPHLLRPLSVPLSPDTTSTGLLNGTLAVLRLSRTAQLTAGVTYGFGLSGLVNPARPGLTDFVALRTYTAAGTTLAFPCFCSAQKADHRVIHCVGICQRACHQLLNQRTFPHSNQVQQIYVEKMAVSIIIKMNQLLIEARMCL